MAEQPSLDKRKPFQEVFGAHDYRYKQGNRCFDDAGNFLKVEGAPPKDEPQPPDEIAMRAKIRAELEAELKAKADSELKPKHK